MVSLYFFLFSYYSPLEGVGQGPGPFADFNLLLGIYWDVAVVSLSSNMLTWANSLMAKNITGSRILNGKIEIKRCQIRFYYYLTLS